MHHTDINKERAGLHFFAFPRPKVMLCSLLLHLRIKLRLYFDVTRRNRLVGGPSLPAAMGQEARIECCAHIFASYNNTAG